MIRPPRVLPIRRRATKPVRPADVGAPFFVPFELERLLDGRWSAKVRLPRPWVGDVITAYGTGYTPDAAIANVLGYARDAGARWTW